MGTQRIVTLVISLVVVVGGVFFLRGKSESSKTLHICTWSNYFSDQVLSDFTKSTGIKVKVSYFSSNEELFSKLRAGASGFDIIQPSDYMVKRMTGLSMLTPLDHSKLSNLGQLDDPYQNPPYDPGLKYVVPFTWGTTGIAVNTSKVKLPVDGVGWKLLMESPDPRHTSLLDDMREVFGAALLWRGHDLNAKQAELLTAAKTDISAVKNRILMFSSEPKPLLLREEVHVAHIFSTDGIQAHAANPAIQYFIPKEGGTIWTDNFAIPKASQLVDEAHVFMNYFLLGENALAIVRENHLGTVNRSAKTKIPKDELENPNIYPPAEIRAKLKYMDDLGDTGPELDRMWTELKS